MKTVIIALYIFHTSENPFVVYITWEKISNMEACCICT